MAWELVVYFGDNRMPDGVEGTLAYSEAFDTKAEANNRGQELLSDGYLITHDSVTHFFPGSSITHIILREL